MRPSLPVPPFLCIPDFLSLPPGALPSCVFPSCPSLTSCPSPCAQPLDFESKKAFTLKVEATNLRSEPGSGGPYRDTATVKVVVEDSDEPPVFTRPAYVLEVNENAPVNTVIGTVNARDPDTTGSLVR